MLILTTKKSFEVFVLTGQAEAYEDKTFKQSFKNVYRKGIDEDIVALFNDIKKVETNLETPNCAMNTIGFLMFVQSDTLVSMSWTTY